MKFTLRNRLLVLGVAVLATLTALLMYVFRPQDSRRDAATSSGLLVTEGVAPGLNTSPRLLRVTSGSSYRGDLAASTGPGVAVHVALSCNRVHATKRVGACVVNTNGILANSNYELVLFDASYHPFARHTSPGIVSRVRISPGSRYVAVTAFVQGHSYGGAFSTQTIIYDARTAAPMGDLETFDLRRHGRDELSPKKNIWGVTFSDDDNFFVTVGIGDERVLAKGRISTHAIDMMPFSVECPSLSPDGTRIAFKKKLVPLDAWHLAVLDLRTNTVTTLPSDYSIDDQAMWIDNDTLAYSVPNNYRYKALPASQRIIIPTDTMEVAADGKSQPHVFLAGSESLVVVR